MSRPPKKGSLATASQRPLQWLGQERVVAWTWVVLEEGKKWLYSEIISEAQANQTE